MEGSERASERNGTERNGKEEKGNGTEFGSRKSEVVDGAENDVRANNSRSPPLIFFLLLPLLLRPVPGEDGLPCMVRATDSCSRGRFCLSLSVLLGFCLGLGLVDLHFQVEP